MRSPFRRRGGFAGIVAFLSLSTHAFAEDVEVPPSEASRPEGTPDDVPIEMSAWGAITVLGKKVAPGQKVRASLKTSQTFSGRGVKVPVTIVRGLAPGATVCLTAGIHGDELNGIEVVRRAAQRISPHELAGTVIGVPIVNIHGFRRSSRYLPDRRDLNRYFPGRKHGSVASRIALEVFSLLKTHCHRVVDFHSASFHRTNLPQIRADISQLQVMDLALAFGARAIVYNRGGRGTLRRALTDIGIPAITYEAGEADRFQKSAIEAGVQGIERLIGRYSPASAPLQSTEQSQLFYQSRWVRSDFGGILLTEAVLGQRVERGDVLGTVQDPFSDENLLIHSPFDGLLLGRAVPQVVIPGFAAFHIGLEASVPSREGDDPELEPDAPGEETQD